MRACAWTVLLAASLAPLNAAAQSPHADGATLSVETRAQDLYQAGRRHFHAGEFAEAEGDFRRSLDLVDSPNTRMYLGRSLLRLGRLPESWAVFDRAALDAERRAATEPRYAATSASARAEAGAIRGSIGLLTVRVSPTPEQATMRVGDAVVSRAAIGVPLPVVPGETEVEIAVPGFVPARRTVTLRAGETASIDVVLEPVPVPPVETPPAAPVRVASSVPAESIALVPPPPFWTTRRLVGLTVLGAGAAAALTGLGFGFAAWTEHQTLATQDPADPALISQGELHRDLANGLLVAGSSIALGGLLLTILGGRGVDSPVTRNAVRVGLAPGVRSLALHLGGAF